MATAATLNPEPSLPSEREKLHIPQKSYLAAAHENLNSVSHDTQPTPELYSGKGEEEVASRSPRRNLHKKSGSLRVNGHPKERTEPDVVVERYQDKDGERLVSIRPASDGAEGQRRPIRRNSELVSGRKAGARWEQSRYACPHDPLDVAVN